MKKEPTFSEQLAEFTRISSELSKKTSQIDQFIKAANQLSLALKDKKSFQEMLSLLAKLEQRKSQTRPTESAGKSDDLYDLFNSPAMQNIVREVMKNRKKP